MSSDTPRTNAHVKRMIDNGQSPEGLEYWARDLERELNAANERIKRLEEATQDRDKEWFQVIESVLGFHPVSITDALRIGIERIKKQKRRIKRLEEAGDELCVAALYTGWNERVEAWKQAKEAKP